MPDMQIKDLAATTTLPDTAVMEVQLDPAGVPTDAHITGAHLKAAMGLVKYKSADQSVTSSTTVVDDTHLFFPVGTSETWIVDYFLFASGATGGDFKSTITVPAGSTLLASVTGHDSGVTSASGSIASGSTTTSGVEFTRGTTGGSASLFMISAYVVTGGTAGNVRLRWAQGSSNATATILVAGSHLIARRVA